MSMEYNFNAQQAFTIEEGRKGRWWRQAAYRNCWGKMKFLASLECGMSFLFCQRKRLLFSMAESRARYAAEKGS